MYLDGSAHPSISWTLTCSTQTPEPSSGAQRDHGLVHGGGEQAERLLQLAACRGRQWALLLTTTTTVLFYFRQQLHASNTVQTYF